MLKLAAIVALVVFCALDGAEAQPCEQMCYHAQSSDRQRAAHLIERYFSALDHGAYDEAYDLLSPSQRIEHTRVQFIDEQTQFKQRAGPLVRRHLSEQSWFVGFESSLETAQVNFAANYADHDRYCGFVDVEFSLDDKTLSISSAYTVFVDNAEAPIKADPRLRPEWQNNSYCS